MSGRLILVTRESDLAPYLEAWRKLAPTPMQSPEWMLAWWAAFQTPTARLNVLIAQNEQGEVIGLAPFYVRESWAVGRSLRFLGSGKACSDFQTLLTAPGNEKTVVDLVANWLLNVTGDRRWSFIELEGISADDQANQLLLARLQTHGCQLQTTNLENTWRIDLSDGWKGFLSRLSKTQRAQTRNIVNRFERNEGWTLQHASRPADTGQAVQDCMQLHQSRWNAVGEPGCFADARFRRFIENAVEGLAARTQVQLMVLADRGLPLAALMFLRDRAGNLFMYQSGRDPQRDRENVGRMLNALAIRAACDAGIQFVDYLRGDEIYKARLGATAAPCLRVRAVATSSLPRLRHGLWTLGREMKHTASALRQRLGNTSHRNSASRDSSGDIGQSGTRQASMPSGESKSET